MVFYRQAGFLYSSSYDFFIVFYSFYFSGTEMLGLVICVRA